MLLKTADTKIIKVADGPGRRLRAVDGNGQPSVSDQLDQDLLNPELFRAVAEVYSVSPDPKDYVYFVARGVTAETPNNNGDAFPKDELLRFSLQANRMVYQTFINDPLHINHRAEDPTQARGFLLDAHYNAKDQNDEFVEILGAADATKDENLAKGLVNGSMNMFSMGCLAGFTRCSICQNVATSEEEFCGHIREQKMQRIGTNRSLVFERCYAVEFTELSDVTDPADVKCVERALLRPNTRMVRQREAYQMDRTLPIQSLGLNNEEADGVARYFAANLSRIPPEMVTLGDALFSHREAH